MLNEDKNIGGSLVLDLRIWWRHVKTLYLLGANFLNVLCGWLSYTVTEKTNCPTKLAQVFKMHTTVFHSEN